MNLHIRHTCSVTPFFLSSGKGNLFCTLYECDASPPATCGILFFPPFAEEMNKSRRIVAEQARRFAAMGYAVLVPDLYGTGDSEGDFGQASWDAWRDDVDRLVRWLSGRGIGALYFWGLRLGALLALECAGRYPDVLHGLLFWQPALNGRNFLTQFLRLKVAADMLDESRKTTTRELRERLESGCSIEISGYQIAPELALPIDRTDLARMPLQELPGITWFELLPGSDRPMPAATGNIISKLRGSGLDVAYHSVAGEPFWSLLELVAVPDLIDATCHHVPSSELCQQ